MTALSTLSPVPSLAQTLSKDVETPAYPLEASANRRYLVDQNNRPFLMVGDSPQNLLTNLSPDEAVLYMANRQQYGINTLWINLLCIFTHPTMSCHKQGETFDGIAPFTVFGDLSTPNPRYFARVDDMLEIARRHGMLILLNPAETISWLDILRQNGEAKAFQYGQYLGSRFRDTPNIIWMHGNDFQSWRSASDTALVQAVARGIMSVDQTHMHTVLLNFFTSGSLDDPRWSPLIGLDAVYTYYPTYGQVLAEYNRPSFRPVFLAEATYEFEADLVMDDAPATYLRRQQYWTMLSGAAGQLYGSKHTWQLKKGWQSNLDTPGVLELSYTKDLFAAWPWYDLVPDQDHEVMTGGYHAFSCLVGNMAARFGQSQGFIQRVLAGALRRGYALMASNTCATAARTADGALVIAYMPSPRTITIDMSRLARPATARWYDPTRGDYVEIAGSPFANRGSRQFTPPGSNGAGEGDWVLVLEAQAAR